MRLIPRSRKELIDAVSKSYPGRKSDVREMDIKRLRKMYKVIATENLIKLLGGKNEK